MIDHITLQVEDYARSKTFYAAALAPLGYGIVMEYDGSCGLGRDGKPDFWIHGDAPTKPGVHIAFASPDRKTVDAFHAAALKAGGRDNGAPGIRAHYHPNYYGAFVIDPEGHNIEAVCRTPA
jgi:catechol 2,3-dioxygenase-like lactoylglutathione lyase family enzyme